jgi:hypothetical protein
MRAEDLDMIKDEPENSVQEKDEEEGLISSADYKQVYEETCMSVIEGLLKHAKRARISNAPQMLKGWIDYYWRSFS